MNAKGVIGVMAGFVLVVGACSEPEDSASSQAVPTVEAAPEPYIAPTPIAAPEPPKLTVKRVIDGDTFELADGTKVRPLGIDSCEMNTPAGKSAKEAAEGSLLGAEVVLRPQPGAPDKDRYGRLLRYVDLWSGDFGSLMVAADHTGIYQGKNDASPEYLAKLRALDNGGRNCALGPLAYTPGVDGGGGGDDDGESRFCRKRRWC